MICPDCGKYRKATASMVSRAKSENISALCPGCHSRYIVTADTVTAGDEDHELASRRNAVQKERIRRQAFRPKKSIDELNEEARAHGMTYGKYVSMLYMQKLKGEGEG